MRGKASIILLVLLAAQVFGLGIAPGTLDADSSTPQKMFIINNEHKDMKVLVYAEGDYADNVAISHSIVTLKSTDEMVQFTAAMEKTPDKPGSHPVRIIAVEIPDESSDTIVARQAVAAVLNLVVPYPGKYADAELVIPKKQAGEPLEFVVKITNRGTGAISKAQARIEVYSPANEMLASLTSDEKAVNAGEMRELVARYHNELKEGKYFAKAYVNYDGEEIVLEQPFSIGNMLVDIRSVYVKDFSLGEIARFDIMIESKWNEQIPDIFADMEIHDRYGKEIAQSKTKEVDLPAGGVDVLDAYWDTDEVTVGQYNAKITLHFLGNNLEKTLTLNVREDAIDIDFMPTARAVEDIPGENTSFIIILIVLSMVFNAGLIFWLARRKK